MLFQSFYFLHLLPWSEVLNPDAASPFATIFARVGIPHAGSNRSRNYCYCNFLSG